MERDPGLFYKAEAWMIEPGWREWKRTRSCTWYDEEDYVPGMWRCVSMTKILLALVQRMRVHTRFPQPLPITRLYTTLLRWLCHAPVFLNVAMIYRKSVAILLLAHLTMFCLTTPSSAIFARNGKLADIDMGVFEVPKGLYLVLSTCSPVSNAFYCSAGFLAIPIVIIPHTVQ